MRQGFILKFFFEILPCLPGLAKSGQNIFFASGENVFLLFFPQNFFFISGSSVRLIRDATSLIRPPPVKKSFPEKMTFYFAPGLRPTGAKPCINMTIY